MKSLDRDELLVRVGHDEELAREILEIFQTDLPELRRLLRIAVESSNAEETGRVAHTFKGMLANISANPAAAAAARLEDIARSGANAELVPSWRFFDGSLESLLSEVEQLLAGTFQ